MGLIVECIVFLIFRLKSIGFYDSMKNRSDWWYSPPVAASKVYYPIFFFAKIFGGLCLWINRLV